MDIHWRVQEYFLFPLNDIYKFVAKMYKYTSIKKPKQVQ